MNDRLFLACSICNTSLDRGVGVENNGHPYPRNNLYAGKHYDPSWVSQEITCPLCGVYRIEREAYEYAENLLRKQKESNILSHYIARRGEKQDALKKENLEKALKNINLPTPSEQADFLLLWIENNSVNVGDRIHVDPCKAGAWVGAFGDKSLSVLFQELKDSRFLRGDLTVFYKDKHRPIPDGAFFAELTLLGWERVDKIKRGNIKSKTAFIAMKFNDQELDDLVSQHIKPALSDIGYNLMRLDDNPVAGLIDDNLRSSIRSARFVIVDLTHDNSGAYWEAGYAEGLGKVVIYICKEQKFKATASHFDTNHHLHVLWDSGKIDEFIKKLKATIDVSVMDVE